MNEISAWHNKQVNEILSELDVVTNEGLNTSEVAMRKERFGINELPRGINLHWWELFLRQFLNPLIFILLAAAGITFLLKEYVDSGVIFLAVLVNVVIGFSQEFQLNRILEKLQKVVRISAFVKRDGKVIEVLMEELVPGDIIILKNDLKVPADARILKAENLLINEAVLTGESHAVSKTVKVLHGVKSLGDRTNMAYLGTIVERGDGVAVVVAIGKDTELGKIASLTVSVEDGMTPLQERLTHMGKLISIFVVSSALIIFSIGFLDPLRTPIRMFEIAVAIAVAAIPEGLPAALSVVLAVSASRILRKKGLVKKLIAAETLGSTTVIVTDKTGTMTYGKMAIKELVGTIDSRAMVRALALSSNALVVVNSSGGREVRGDSTDRAKIEYCYSSGINFDELLEEFPRLAFLPFDESKKYIASFYNTKSGIWLFVSGAPEILLGSSDLPKDKRVAFMGQVEEYAGKGYRMVGAAQRFIESGEISNLAEDKLHEYVSGLEFLGIAAIRDPVRTDVHEAMRITREAGIKVIMATGDHLLTAESIGKELGFHIDPESVITGEEIDKLSFDEIKNRVRKMEIVARVSPSHKVKIVEALREIGEVVAMTGDGVNDAPALRAADIGVALGSGTEVTKETADLVLIDDSFSIITAAIEQGRIAFDNIRKVTIFLLANSFSELILVVTSLILRLPLPLTAAQILWANLVEDGLPNFALAFEPGEKDVMKRKPLKRGAPILDKLGKTLVFIVGIFSDLVLVGFYLGLYYWLGYENAHLQTVIFAAIAVDSLIYIFSIKSLHEPIFRENIFNNKYLLFAVGAELILVGISLYVPTMNYLLGTMPLGLFDLSLVFATGVTRLGLIEGTKWWMKGRVTLSVI